MRNSAGLKRLVFDGSQIATFAKMLHPRQSVGCNPGRPKDPIPRRAKRGWPHGHYDASGGREVTNLQRPVPYGEAARAVRQCAATTVTLLGHRQIHLPSEHVGMRLSFADGTSARVFRETVVDRQSVADPSILLVAFRLYLVRGRGHAIFRKESLLNTPLFVGFPGLVSKLWVAHDEHDVYRGLYEWDGATRAEHYARSLWQVLALGCEPSSIHYHVLPGIRRDDLLRDPHVLDDLQAGAESAWWRLTKAA